MMDRLACMEAFIRAVEAGSFAAAAVQAGTSPQMVAKQVAYLEARLGTSLLHRTTRRQSLTEAGGLYYGRCKEILAAAADAETLTADVSTAPRGHLRITAPASFGCHSLMPVVTAFLTRNDQLSISLNLTDRLVDIVEEGFDAAIRIGTSGLSGLRARALAPYRLIACASPAYLARRGTPAEPTELAAHELLGYAYRSRPPEKAWMFTRGTRNVSVPATGRMEVNDCNALLAAALDGFGIAIGPEDVMIHAVEAGRLVRVLPDCDVPTRPMHLLSASDRRRSRKLQAFEDLVLSAFAEPDAVGRR